MVLEKGEWKHCWEGLGEAFEVLCPDKKRRYRRKYECKTCGARITAKASGKIRMSDWKGQDVDICSRELVKQVHNL